MFLLGLHAFAWNVPGLFIGIDLRPKRTTGLSRSRSSENCELERELDNVQTIRRAHRRNDLRYFAVRACSMVFFVIAAPTLPKSYSNINPHAVLIVWVIVHGGSPIEDRFDTLTYAAGRLRFFLPDRLQDR